MVNAGLIKFGVISECKPESGLYRVKLEEDDMVTRFIPVLNPNTLKTKTENPLSVNEHVCCLMDERCENGVILGAIYSSADKPTDTAGEDIFKTTWEDGSVVSFDKSKGEYTLDMKGDVVIKTAKKVKITGDVEVSGKITATGDVVGAHVSLQSHQHPYINVSSPATTSPPTPGA
jgi:phage baseplate assembly protein gpV